MRSRLLYPALRAVRIVEKVSWRVRRPLTLGVRALVLNERNEFLLVRHTYIDGWYFPGGGVDKGESLENAVARELVEEVGVHLNSAPTLVGAYTYLQEYKSDHVILYATKDWSIEPCTNLEIAESGFYSADRLPSDTSPGTLRRIAEYFGDTPQSDMW